MAGSMQHATKKPDRMPANKRDIPGLILCHTSVNMDTVASIKATKVVRVIGEDKCGRVMK